MRASRPSLTATLVAGARAFYAALPDALRVAPDPHAAALAPGPLAWPSHLIARAPWAAAAAHRALGYATVGLLWHVGLRTRAIDDALRDAVREGARQIVLLGAGLDNRAARLDETEAARVFEVDHPDMQRYKRARLERAGLAGDGRVLVPVDFERDSLGEALDRAGFSADRPAFWIWEGVTPYLTREAVSATLQAVAARSAAGSRLAVTYVRPPDVLGHTINRLSVLLTDLVGEPLHARYTQQDMAALLSSFGFAVLSDEADIDLANRYWKDPPAAHPGSMAAFPEWERLAVAERIS